MGVQQQTALSRPVMPDRDSIYGIRLDIGAEEFVNEVAVTHLFLLTLKTNCFCNLNLILKGGDEKVSQS